MGTSEPRRRSTSRPLDYGASRRGRPTPRRQLSNRSTACILFIASSAATLYDSASVG
jgi:hypothetical protein